jgi:hypothetical protein
MAGRGPQSFKKRQKEQQRKEKQEEKRAKRLERKQNPGAFPTIDYEPAEFDTDDESSERETPAIDAGESR